MLSTRRSKLRHAISSAATIAIVVIVIIIIVVGAYAALSLGKSTTTPTTTPTTTTTPSGQAPTFVKDNTYVLESPANFQYLDPQVSYYSYDYGVLQNVYETLLWWNGTNGINPIPWLATNFTEVNPSTYVLGLQQGVTFQDGTPFNATAVCFTFDRSLVMDAAQPTGPGVSSGWIIEQLVHHSYFTFYGASPSYNSTWVSDVLGMNFCQVLSNYKVQFNLVHPSASFPVLLAGEWAAIVSPSWVIAHDDPAAITSSGVNYAAYYEHTAGNGTTALNLPASGSKAGTGPYVITSVNPTTYEIILTANSNYWGGPTNYMFGKIKPTIQTIDMKVVGDETTRLLDLKAGKATVVTVTPDNIFSVISRTAYDANGSYISNTPGVVFRGPYPYYNTGWFQFNVNVTNSAGQLLSFQPFADARFRMAVSDAVNVTDVLDSLTYGLDSAANFLYPPGTLPNGTYVANAKPGWSYNLTAAESLLKSACSNPLTSFTYYNGSAIPSGVINNKCSGQTIPLYYQNGDTITEKLLATVAANLNQISATDSLGLTFETVPVPAGTLYTLAGEHQIYGYWAGWIDDYNWAIDWTGPMFSSTGTYPAWSQWNFTYWNNLVSQAALADQQGNISGIVAAAVALGNSNNQADWYWLHEYQLYYWVGSTWVNNWFYNSEFIPNAEYFAALSFAPPASS